MRYLIIIVLLLITQLLLAQKWVSTKSSTSFYSNALLEDIAATTQKGKSVIDTSNGNIAFLIPIKSFEFDKSLMQEHFNEKYMESEKYPKASFSGVIMGWEKEKSMDEATAKGKLTIHGITKEVTAKGSINFDKKKLILKAKFIVKLEDYGIEVPSLMFQKIAEVLEVTVNYEYLTDEN